MKRVGHKSVMQRVGEKWFLVLNYRNEYRQMEDY